MKIAYPAQFEADEDGRILVTFRDFPEAATDGVDLAEARTEAVDLLNSVLSFRMKYREDVPAPSKCRKNERAISPDAAVAWKIALYLAMLESGMSIADLARRLKVDNREVQRIMDPAHPTKIARMSEALAATGHETTLELHAS
ncbi:MAG: type II toxin-antitoxin system HicB family antitoxin [Alphaproteobacteria bacterium]|jgi:antitoxin HicB|nr:type II toxin-antitoxin system HicB family antitoxin [Alphaproteobacteria bacterium]